MSTETNRFFLALFATIVGGCASTAILFARLPYRANYSRDSDQLLLWNAMHCIAICILLWLWFGEQRPNLHTGRGVANIIGAAVVGTLLAVLFPSA